MIQKFCSVRDKTNNLNEFQSNFLSGKNLQSVPSFKENQNFASFANSHSSVTKRTVFKEQISEFKKYSIADLMINSGKKIVLETVQKFINKLKYASYFRDISVINPENELLINDKSFFLEKINKKKKFSKKLLDFFCFTIKNKTFKSLYKKIDEKIIIHPYENKKTVWDLIHLAMIIYWIFTFPIFFSFEKFKLSPNMNIFSFLFFTVDILINFRTAYFSNGCFETNRKKIFNNYLKKNFFSDLVSFIPIFLVVFIQIIDFNDKDEDIIRGKRFYSLFIVLRLLNLQRIYQRLVEKFMLQETFQNVLALFKVFFVSLIVSHFFACFWFFIGHLSMYNNEPNWLELKNLYSEDWNTYYLYSIYWSILTMMTVGYGDITPQNSSEIIITLITIFLGGAVYAYNINSIGEILKNIHRQKMEYRHNINIINHFMVKKNINPDLQMRIREYLRFIWNEEKIQNISEEQKIIDMLGGSLKDELLLESYGAVFKQYPVFWANFTKSTITKLASIIKDIKLIPSEILFEENDKSDYSIYFVIKGSIELFHKNEKNLNGNQSEISLQTLTQGKTFGEISFFTGNIREYSARSKNFTSLLAIKREDFLKILSENSDDFEKFCMIKDQIVLYENLNSIKIKCHCCKEVGHYTTKCPLIHYIPDKEKIIKKFEFYKDQEREINFVRPRRYFLNSRKDNKIYKTQAEEYIKNEEEKLKVENENFLENTFEKNLKESIFDSETSIENIDEKPTLNSEAIRPKSQECIKINTKINSLLKISNLNKMDSSESLDNEIQNDDLDLEITKSKIISPEMGFSRGKTLDSKLNNFEKLVSKERFSSNPTHNTSQTKIYESEKTKINSLDENKEIFQINFESAKKFKNFFPEGNVEEILEKLNKNSVFDIINREHDKKKNFKLNNRLSKYTFEFYNMKNRMPSEIRKKKKIKLILERRKTRNASQDPNISYFSHIEKGEKLIKSQKLEKLNFYDVVQQLLLKIRSQHK